MRISKKYRLGLTQPSLDFVDVDTKNDTKVFLSPTAISSLPSDWGDTSVSLIQNFFRHVLDLIKQGRHENAEALLRILREPNETHLGLSRGRSQGRALGKGSAKELWKALSKSKAAQSGLLVDLEDAALMIEGISVDIISDITTNIIRGPLIEYTQRMCEQHGIPTVDGVESGPVWNPQATQWTNDFARLPVTESGKLLLVPKAIVRQRPDYDAGEYYRHFLLTLMSGAGRRVFSSRIIEKWPTTSDEKTPVREIWIRQGSDSTRDTKVSRSVEKIQR
jgi:hypothetical protein